MLSRPATDTLLSRPPSPLATPASKPQIPTICLTTATPCDANSTNGVSQVAPWITSKASHVLIAPKPTSGETSRKRLVPKKSKLNLLGSSSSSAKAREQDFSDVVRRVAGASVQNGSNGFEIYVDPANDPDIGEILMVKKKKSRLALDGMQWGTLGEVTNVPSVMIPKEKGGKKESLKKAKVDENQKWWSIGRGRRDSKEKEKVKDKGRAKSPQPTDKPADTRTRFNSLDSGILLTNPVHAEHPKSPVEHVRVPTPPPVAPGAAASGSGKDSVAIRAMRSVRSLARIGSWAQLKNTPNPDAAAVTIKDKESDGKKKKKKKDKAKETNRSSGSSFEAGALSASPAAPKNESKSLGKKKASILGLGLPSTIRLPSSRSGSTASSVVASNTVNHRLSVDSAGLLGGGVLARGRSGSTMSAASSLRPMSTKSCGSRESSGSSGVASVKWDEAGLQTVKEIRRKEKETRSKEKEEKKKKLKKSKSGKDSTRKSSDSWKRSPLAAIFPGVVSERDERERPPVTPVVAIEEATVDGHELGRHEADVGNSPMETPVKYVRHRPVSDQPLARNRPKPSCEGDDGEILFATIRNITERIPDNAVMSLLDAATNDLAQLINRLDLEATPGSVEMTPMSHRSQFFLEPCANSSSNNRLTGESPVKGLRRTNSSMTSLRPYVQLGSKSVGVQLGQNIAPWSTLNAGISPSKPSPSTMSNFQDNMATVRKHRRTLTPAPAVDPSPVFKALRPATTRLPTTVVGASTGISPFVTSMTDRSPSTQTFGSGHSKAESRGTLSVSPVFKKAQGYARKTFSLVPRAALDDDNLPILPEVRRNLGLAGTMGGSVGSIAEQDYDGSDPDSDIPDELQVILSNSDQEGDDTISFDRAPAPPPASPGLPPEMPLPVLDSPSPRSSLSEIPGFRAAVVNGDDHHTDVEETLSEDDTKRSFDFTGELQKLNESGASDRRSFIEQLENAFRTPAKVDLRCDFGDLPPIPQLNTLQDELSRAGESSFSLPIGVNAEPSLRSGLDSFATTAEEEEEELLNIIAPEVLRNVPSVASRPSDGQLNRDFKFGGKHSSSNKKDTLPLTLSDIIPPPEIARSLSMASFPGDEDSLMGSILAHAIEIESPPKRPRLDSGASSQRETRNAARNSHVIAGHQRNPSVLSFVGFDSFAEVRRGFEFNDSRPGFYPLPNSTSDRRHRKHESFYSIASVSSYGNVLHGGSADPFDYGSVVPLPSLRERPSSDDFSFTMSTSVDDTFSFLRRQPLRRRVDSDASSYYPRTSLVHPYSRGHRRQDSGVSVGPPVSLFNHRNSTYHRRRRLQHEHRQRCPLIYQLPTIFLDSTSIKFFGRIRVELAVYAENESVRRSTTIGRRTTRLWTVGVSLKRPTRCSRRPGCRNSVCSSDSTFFEQHSDNDAAKPPRYRPISSLSVQSVHSPPKEDDTMISMLGGGHVRRRSVTSMIGASPCIQVERRKNILANPPETVFSRIKSAHPEDHESPVMSRVIETKPSIASTVNSFKFGDERMIRAKHGLLERQSLENTALMGDGEDFSGSFRLPVFTRPKRANRSRSSTCTSSSGAETPPLSISDGYSSFSEGSLSSIDLSQLNVLLSNATQPLSNATFDRARPHVRGHGHRRRISQARASRTSVYETIEEEFTSPLSHMSSPEQSTLGSTPNTIKLAKVEAKTMDPPQVYVMDPETSSVESYSLWDDERGITALRRYYALRDEAEDCGHGEQTYVAGHAVFSFRASIAEHLRATVAASLATSIDNAVPRRPFPGSTALQQITVNPNIQSTVSAESKECVISPDKPGRILGVPARPCVGPTTRRGAFGWSKKSTGRNGIENKENNTTIGNINIGAPAATNVSQGAMMTPSDGLRLNRPRPRGRPMPASVRPIRA
ncbi:hypothetical protein J3R82DRAFT_2877 [Butyriboletus roseoflavus]|nr:hypothetical protein J3R82DRAFT_2877 [Butyriboletus roseoflavus]